MAGARSRAARAQGIAEQGTEIRSGIRLSRQLAAHASVLLGRRGPARGDAPTD